MQREYPLNTYTAGYLAHSEGLIHTTMLPCDTDTFKNLNAFLGTLTRQVEHTNHITRSKVQVIFPELLFFDFVDQVGHAQIS